MDDDGFVSSLCLLRGLLDFHLLPAVLQPGPAEEHPLGRESPVPLHPALSAVTQHCCFRIKPWGYFCWRTMLINYTHGLILGDLTWWGVRFMI